MPRGMIAQAWQVVIAVDQLVNTLAGGWADETLSARAWRLQSRRVWGLLRRTIDAAFFFDPSHCEQAFKYESQRGHLPPAYRD